jgi:hypothetical protein
MSTLAYGLNYLSTSWADLGRPTVTLILSCRMLGTVWYGTVRYGTVRYGTVRYGTVRYGTVRYGTVRYGTPHSYAHPLLQDVRYSTVPVRYGTARHGTVRPTVTLILSCSMLGTVTPVPKVKTIG